MQAESETYGGFGKGLSNASSPRRLVCSQHPCRFYLKADRLDSEWEKCPLKETREKHPAPVNKTISEDFHFVVILAGALPTGFCWGLEICVFRCWLLCLMLSARGAVRGQIFSSSNPPFPLLDFTEVAAHTQMHFHLLFPEKSPP